MRLTLLPILLGTAIFAWGCNDDPEHVRICPPGVHPSNWDCVVPGQDASREDAPHWQIDIGTHPEPEDDDAEGSGEGSGQADRSP